VGVAILPGRDFEVEILVVRIGQSLADVPLDAAGAQDGAGDAERDGVLAGDFADALGAFEPDTVGGEEFLVLVDLRLYEVDEVSDVIFEAFVRLVLQASKMTSE